MSEVESNTCVFDHVARIGSIIDTAAPNGEDAPFLADYILTITWEDMGCVPGSNPLVRTLRHQTNSCILNRYFIACLFQLILDEHVHNGFGENGR